MVDFFAYQAVLRVCQRRCQWAVSARTGSSSRNSREMHHRAARPDQSVDNAADDAGGTAADKGNQIKLEKADQPPVDPADDRQDQSNFVKHRKPSLSSNKTRHGLSLSPCFVPLLCPKARKLCLYEKKSGQSRSQENYKEKSSSFSLEKSRYAG